MIMLCLGILLGTVGLAWMHYCVHKYDIFNISIVWKKHKLHHLGNDLEQKQRQLYTMPMYSLVRTVGYFAFWDWSILDLVVFILGILYPNIGFIVLMGIFVAENIGYLQHTYLDHPICFTNKFDNLIGFDCGYHTKHHGNDSQYSTNTEVIWGLFCSYLWLLIVLVLYPIMIFNPTKANVPGAYIFGFFRNLANYRKQEGFSIVPLLRRMPSIFDDPSILSNYIRIMFRKEITAWFVVHKIDKPHRLNYSHPISNNRNVYKLGLVPTNKRVLVYKNEILEGHHRHDADLDLDYYKISAL